MLTTSDVRRLLEHYNLGSVRQVSRAPHGFVNETAFVRTDEGLFVVRRMHRRLSEAVQNYRHRLISWLIAHNAPAPEVIAARDGSTLITIDGRYYEVQAYVTGEEFNPDRPGQLAGVGGALGCYHCAIEGFPAPPDESIPRYSPQRMLGFVEQLIERDILGELQELLSWYDARAAQLRPRFSEHAYGALPHLVIHGDVHADNFLFAGDKVTALLDYDQATWDARIVDLADALVAFATGSMPENALSQWGVYRGPLDEDRAVRLIAAYLEANLLTQAEIAALPTLIEVLWMQNELGRVVSTPEGAPDYHLSVLAQGRWLSVWMSEHSQRLLGRWT